MSNEKQNIPLHYRDIVQKHFTGFIAAENAYPLSSLGVETSQVKRMLNNDISTIIEGKRVDCLMEMEDESLLHIEFQSDYDKNDLIRFWRYDFLILDHHKDEVKKYSYPNLRTIVIFSANVKREDVDLETRIGTHRYRCEGIFLSEHTDNRAIYELLNEIGENPDKKLSPEDMVTIVYGTLAIQYIDEINNRVYNIAKIVNTLRDEATKATLLSAIYILTKKFLDDSTLRKLEELMTMLNAFEEIEKEIRKEGKQEGLQEGREEEKLAIAKELIGLLADEIIIKKTGISADQLESLKKNK